MTLLADRHLGEAVVAECVKHFVGNTSLETFDRFRYKKRIYVNLVVISEKCRKNQQLCADFVPVGDTRRTVVTLRTLSLLRESMVLTGG